MALKPLPDYRPLELMKDPKITNFEFDDFIGVWHNLMPKPTCDILIEYMKRAIETGSSYQPEDEGEVPDHTMSHVVNSAEYYGGNLNRRDFAFLMNYNNITLCRQVNSVLNSCLKHYIDEYYSIKESDVISLDIKCQMTPPGGGYHLWHHEDGDLVHAARELVWMIYLNDMPDGEAETEFLYQRRRFKPRAGTVLLWPAGFTHTHKGNTVLTEDKYILTGWYIKNK